MFNVTSTSWEEKERILQTRGNERKYQEILKNITSSIATTVCDFSCLFVKQLMIYGSFETDSLKHLQHTARKQLGGWFALR